MKEMNIVTVIASICSILGFVLGVATSKWGRTRLLGVLRTLRRPLLGYRLARLGIANFYESRESLSKNKSTQVFDYLSKATKEIGIIGTSLNYSIVHQNLHLDLKRVLQEDPDIRINVFLMDPESPIVPSVARATSRSASDIKQYILQSEQRLHAMAESLDDNERKRFSVHFFDLYIANSILIVDPYEKHGRFLVEHYVYSGSIHGRYSIEYRRPSSSMYKKMLGAYEQFKEDFACSTSTRRIIIPDDNQMMTP